MNRQSLPKIKHPVHPSPIDVMGRPTVLFVTVRVTDRSHCLAREDSHAALLHAWNSAEHWKPGLYVIMPDHVHLFCTPGVPEPLGIKAWCKYWKGQYRRALSLNSSVWQRDCWDTQMRNYDHYAEKASYVRMNPVRKGLVEKPEDWAFQGELKRIQW